MANTEGLKKSPGITKENAAEMARKATQKRKENAALTQNTRHKTSTFLSYTRAPPYAAYGVFPPP